MCATTNKKYYFARVAIYIVLTIGMKAWHMWNMLLTFRLKLLSQTSSSHSRIVPWWTYLRTVTFKKTIDNVVSL